MSAKNDSKKSVQTEGVKQDEYVETRLSFSAYVLLFGVVGALVAVCEAFLDFIPAWECLALLSAVYMSRVFRDRVLQLCLDLDIEVGTAVFLRRVAEMTLLAMASIPILNSVGVQTTSLTAVLTSCTFALGLASQEALRNMAAGIMIMIFQPYKIGDRVELSDVSGFVYDIQLSETLINTFNNERVSLPNSGIYGKKTKNFSKNKMVRICEQVAVRLDMEVAATKAALLSAVHKHSHEHVTCPDHHAAEEAKGGEEEEAAAKLIDRLDANKDGLIDASEMVSGLRRAWGALQSWRRDGRVTEGLRDLFQGLDADGNGKLTLSEILSLTGQQVKRCTQALRLKDERRKFEMAGREPKAPEVVLCTILHDKVVWEVRVWVAASRYGEVKAALMEDILVGLKRAQGAAL